MCAITASPPPKPVAPNLKKVLASARHSTLSSPRANGLVIHLRQRPSACLRSCRKRLVSAVSGDDFNRVLSTVLLTFSRSFVILTVFAAHPAADSIGMARLLPPPRLL